MKKKKLKIPRWTEEEEEYLLDSYGTVPMFKLMKKLKRTEEAIISKMKKLEGYQNVSTYSGLLSTAEVADVLGVSQKTINLWIRTQGLPALRAKATRKDDVLGRLLLNPDNVWEWLASNKERVIFTDVKTGVMIPEPQWLLDEIESAKQHPPAGRPAMWTDEEKHQALFWSAQGTNYREIARRLNRPSEGTRVKINKLKRLQERQLKEEA